MLHFVILVGLCRADSTVEANVLEKQSVFNFITDYGDSMFLQNEMSLHSTQTQKDIILNATETSVSQSLT